ncbi:MAG: DUF4861 domain-containing protein [Planctomycetes bacterium]|nr:DUF4861 domain-containing protein [Planctomycetota bacterium]
MCGASRDDRRGRVLAGARGGFAMKSFEGRGRGIAGAGFVLSALTVSALSLPTGCAIPESQVGEAYTTIQLTNPTAMQRYHEPVEIPLSEVRARYRNFNEKDFSAHLLPSNWYPDRGDGLLATDPAPMIPAQAIDKDFDGTADTLLVIADFEPSEKRYLALASPVFSKLAKKSGPRTSGGMWARETTRREAGALKAEGAYTKVQNAVLDPSHQKGDGLYQGDGVLFETDRSAWRVLFDSRLCLDVVGKRDREIRFDPKQKAFTADFLDLNAAPWGGSLLGDVTGFGAGAFGYQEGGTIVPLAGVDSVQYRLIKDGPAATEIEFVMFGARLGAEAFDLRWRMTHYAGGRIIRHDVNVSRFGHGLAFAMNSGGERKESPTGQQSWMRSTSFGAGNATGAAGGELGLAIIASGRTATGFVKSPADVMGVAFDSVSRNLTFYTVAAWNQETGGLRDAQDFQRYVEELVQRLDQPIRSFNLNKTIGS